MEDTDLEKVTLRLPARYIRALDFLVKVDDFPSRSEAIRAAIRDLIYDRAGSSGGQDEKDGRGRENASSHRRDGAEISEEVGLSEWDGVHILRLRSRLPPLFFYF